MVGEHLVVPGVAAAQARTTGGCEQVKVLVWMRSGLRDQEQTTDCLCGEFECLQLQEVATRWRCLEDLRRTVEPVEEIWGGCYLSRISLCSRQGRSAGDMAPK